MISFYCCHNFSLFCFVFIPMCLFVVVSIFLLSFYFFVFHMFFLCFRCSFRSFTVVVLISYVLQAPRLQREPEQPYCGICQAYVEKCVCKEPRPLWHKGFDGSEPAVIHLQDPLGPPGHPLGTPLDTLGSPSLYLFIIQLPLCQTEDV